MSIWYIVLLVAAILTSVSSAVLETLRHRAQRRANDNVYRNRFGSPADLDFSFRRQELKYERWFFIAASVGLVLSAVALIASPFATNVTAILLLILAILSLVVVIGALAAHLYHDEDGE